MVGWAEVGVSWAEQDQEEEDWATHQPWERFWPREYSPHRLNDLSITPHEKCGFYLFSVAPMTNC